MARNVESYSYTALQYISLAEAKAHLRVVSSFTDDDSYITSLLKGCFHAASDYVGYSIRKAKVSYTFQDVDSKSRLRIPARVLSLDSGKYYDSDANPQTLTLATLPNNYGNFGMYVYVTDYPTTINLYGDKFKITVYEGFDIPTSGAELDSTFPDSIRQAIYLMLGTLYDNRQNEIIGVKSDIISMPATYLLNPYRIMNFI